MMFEYQGGINIEKTELHVLFYPTEYCIIFIFYFIGQYVATVMNKRTIWQKLVNKIYNNKWKTKFKKSQNETTSFKRSKRCIHNSYQTKEKLEQSGGPLLTNNSLFFKTAFNNRLPLTFYAFSTNEMKVSS